MANSDDYDLDKLSGMSPVAYDFGVASETRSVLRAAASALRGQRGARAAARNKGSEGFEGYYAELFEANGTQQLNDLDEIASNLDDAATKIDTLDQAARDENKRRADAAAWAQRRKDRGDFAQFFTDVLHTDDMPEPNFSEKLDGPTAWAPATPPPPRKALEGQRSAYGTSAGNTDNLQSFSRQTASLNDSMLPHPGKVDAALAAFARSCSWVTFDASSVAAALTAWNKANVDEITWADRVRELFVNAGGTGMAVPNSALDAALQASGISSSRDDIVVDPPTAMGGQPTSGFADDPVNAATGNFVEPQVDLGFTGGSATLEWGRVYNSMSQVCGAFGPGWSSLAESRLVVTDESARWVQADGRHIVFGRMGEGWGRAQCENLWLEQPTGMGGVAFLIRDNDGGSFAFSQAGRPVFQDRGPGSRVAFTYSEDRLVRLEHEFGRAVELVWSQDGRRVVEALASDGRRVGYVYDEQERLVESTGDTATHRYEWNEQGLMCRVVDADGVVEVDNTYDGQGRVVTQRSPHGRLSRYSYLGGRVTVVCDEDGARANTYVHDGKGRLVGVVDAEDHRQSASWDRFGNQVMVTDREGRTVVRSFDTRGHVIAEQTVSGARIEQDFDEQDRLIEVRVINDDQVSVTEMVYQGDNRNPARIVDPVGGVTVLEWDGSLLTKVVDPTGVTLTMGYDAHGDLVSTTNAAGHTARLERDEQGRVVAAITPLGHTTRYRYDERGMCVERIDPDGAVWRFEYSAGGRLLATVDPLGGRVEVERDEAGEESATIDELGRRVERRVDDLGNLTRVELPDGSAWQFSYDAMSRMQSMKDASGGVWQFSYDAEGTLKATTDATGGVRRYETNQMALPTAYLDDGKREEAVYDRLGRMVCHINADATSTKTRYDLAGLPVEIIDEAGGVTSIERDLAGRPVAVTQPMGQTFRYEYDECGRWAATISTGGDRYEMIYDADGRIEGEVWPTGERVTTTFDECGRAVARREPGRGLTRLKYDKLGRVVWSQDSWYGTRRFRYDAAGQMSEVVNAAGGVTHFAYDELGRIGEVTDPMGGVTRHTYDPMGRLLTSTDPLGRVTRYSYDAAGRVTRRVDGAGASMSWVYDSAGRQVEEWVNDTLLAATTRDFVGRTTTIVEGDARHELRFDVRGNLLWRGRGDQGVRWEYDQNSRRTCMIRPNGQSTSYEYDANNRVSAFIQEGLGRVVIDRDSLGRIVSVFADGLYASWEYADGAVVRQRVERNGFISESVITRDENGRVVADKTDGITTFYSYDQTGQLVRAQTSEGLVTTWEYDANGRMVVEDAAGTVSRFTYDAASQLVSVTNSDGTTTYAYDDAGRRVREQGPAGERRFTWDPRGFLDSITQINHDGDKVAAQTQRLWVDALGELARVDQDSVWWDSSSFMPTLVQYGARSVVTEAGITGMVDGPDASWLPPQWSARDHGGNPMDPWAVATNVGVSAQGSLLVQGMEWMQARVYDPATRGFLSTDPLPGVAGAGWSGNPYAFAGNDPVNFSDPLGLRPLTDEDLKGYRDAARSPLAKAADAAGGWLKNNWEYVAGGAMVAAGGVLMATGVGGPLGGVLLGAGIDTIAQKATTGSVTWGEVAVSGAAGLVGGGLGAAAGKWAAGKAATCLGKNVVSGLTEGAIDGGIGQAGAYWAGPGPHTLRGGLKAVAVGAAGGGLVGGGAGALSTVTDVSRHGCFVAGTQVLMADGTSKNIEDVVAGDMVAAYNPETGQAEPGEVTDTYIHDQVATWQVTTESGTVTTTAVHPFYVDGKGWVEAQDLRAGDQLYDETGSLVTVVSIQATGQIATVYNVTVKDLHNYYVADDSSWVLAHNGTATGCGLGGPGEWGPSKNHGSANARAYELQITGRPEGYYVNGVEFDGYQNGELIDAKGLGYAKLLPAKWSKAAKKLQKTALHQLEAAGSTPIHWIFAEEGAAREASKFIPAKIKISHVPFLR